MSFVDRTKLEYGIDDGESEEIIRDKWEPDIEDPSFDENDDNLL